MINSKRRSSFHRTGFSVLELVVAMTLGMVLLSAIWTMFSIFTKRQELDRSRTETTQLVRGLHQILSRDLGNIVPQVVETLAPKTETEPPFGSYSVFPLQMPFDLYLPGRTEPENATTSSLLGTDSQLQILIFNDGTSGERYNSETNSTTSHRATSSKLVVDWPFKTVVYRFESTDDNPTTVDINEKDGVIVENVPGTTGMNRRETIAGLRGEITAGPAAIGGRHDAEEGLKTHNGTTMTKGKQLPKVHEQLVNEETVPEISNLGFEYYDGNGWRNRWDSRETGALPSAIRVRFSLRNEKKSHSAKREQKTTPEIPLRHSRPENVDEMAPFDHEFVFAVSPIGKAESTAGSVHPPSFDRHQ